MVILARRIKRSLDMPVKRPHRADPREHRRPVAVSNPYRCLHCGLPFLAVVFACFIQN